jgi:hypothetical protein
MSWNVPRAACDGGAAGLWCAVLLDPPTLLDTGGEHRSGCPRVTAAVFTAMPVAAPQMVPVFASLLNTSAAQYRADLMTTSGHIS